MFWVNHENIVSREREKRAVESISYHSSEKKSKIASQTTNDGPTAVVYSSSRLAHCMRFQSCSTAPASYAPSPHPKNVADIVGEEVASHLD